MRTYSCRSALVSAFDSCAIHFCDGDGLEDVPEKRLEPSVFYPIRPERTDLPGAESEKSTLLSRQGQVPHFGFGLRMALEEALKLHALHWLRFKFPRFCLLRTPTNRITSLGNERSSKALPCAESGEICPGRKRFGRGFALNPCIRRSFSLSQRRMLKPNNGSGQACYDSA